MRRVLILIFIAALFWTLGDNILLRGQSMIKYKMNQDLACIKPNWKGNVFVKGRFQNDTIPESAPFLDVIKWKLSRNPQKKEKNEENYSLHVDSLEHFSDNDDRIVWLGHTTFYIQLDGIRIIIDPVFDNIPNTKRKVQFPYNPDSLTNIDYLLISHDHRDHFNKKSIEQLQKNNPSIHALVPLDARRLFSTKQLKNMPIQEAGWYQ